MKAYHDKKLVYCLECEAKFSLADAVAENYFMETGICRKCYAGMKATDVSCNCFGKLYDKNQQQCVEFCPDNVICRDWRDGHTG